MDKVLVVRARQEGIDLIQKWISEHGLELNSAKTNVLPITRSRQPIPLHLCVGNDPISVVSSIKYLGVNVTSDLSWSIHVRNTVKGTKHQLGLLYRKLHLATPQVRHSIYRSAVLPKLEYCSSVWDLHQTTLINELEKTLQFAGRVITNHWKAEYPTLLHNLKCNMLKTCRKISKTESLFQNS